MDCSPICIESVELGNYCRSCSEMLVGLDAFEMFPSRNERQHTGSVPSNVVDVVAVALNIYCM